MTEGADRVGEAISELRRARARRCFPERRCSASTTPRNPARPDRGDRRRTRASSIDRQGSKRCWRSSAPLARVGEVRGGRRLACSRGSRCPTPHSEFRGLSGARLRVVSRARGSSAIVAGRKRRRERSKPGRTGEVGDGPDGLLPGRRRPGRGHGHVDLDGGDGRGDRRATPVPGVIAHRVHVATRPARESGRRSPCRCRSGCAGARRPTTRARTSSTRRCGACSGVGPPDGLSRRARPAAFRLRRRERPDARADRPRSSGWSTRRSCATFRSPRSSWRWRRRGSAAPTCSSARSTESACAWWPCPGSRPSSAADATCGRTGEIGAFKIVSDKGLAAGVRRLEAVTSLGAVELLASDEQTFERVRGGRAGSARGAGGAVAGARGSARALERELQSLKLKLASGDGAALRGRRDVDGVADRDANRRAASRSRSCGIFPTRCARRSRAEWSSSALPHEGKTSVVAAVTPDLPVRVPASRSRRGSARRSAEAGAARRTSRRRAARTGAAPGGAGGGGGRAAGALALARARNGLL